MKADKQSKFILPTMLITYIALLLPCTATAVTINVLQDTTIYNTGTANGSGQGLFAGASGNGTVQRGLVEFDLSSIATGSIITNVTLTMYVNSMGSANTVDTITLNTLSQDWNEATAGGGNATKGGGSGYTANPGDATWTSSGISPWADGAAFNTTISDSLQIGSLGFHTFSGANLITDIQNWVNNPDTNFGWILRGNELTNGSSKRFSSSENTGGGGTNVPVLNIEYQAAVVPVPAAVWLFTSGLLSLIGVSRRNIFNVNTLAHVKKFRDY
jgi:hypothetical protein